MRDVLDELLRRYRAGETVGLGTVVATFSSAPRAPGAAMLVAPDGAVTGSVSGGCVEGAVYELAQEVVEDSKPVLQRYGVSDDDAFAVGLTCGGIIDIFVEPVVPHGFPELVELAESVEAEVPVALATIVEHEDEALLGRRMVVWTDRAAGSLGIARLDDAVADDARGLLAAGRTGDPALRPAGAAARRGHVGVRELVRATAPAARVRRDRLRLGHGRARQLSSATG